MQTLDSALSNFRQPLAILAGAGVSIDPPAGLPSARSLMERALLHMISGLVTFEDLKHIIDRPTDFRTRPGEFLRFEVAMADIDPKVRASILSELQFGTPNANHYALAQLINRGDVVITTNFDVHIETAYKHLYGRPCKVAHRDTDFVTLPSPKSSGVLWKIHGCLTEVNNLAATFTTVLSKGSRRMGWFRHILSNYDLIVVGYSGSDDLDVIPPLAQTITDRSLLWIYHAETSEVRRITPRQWLVRSPARMHLDCVGLTRVMFSCHSADRATRRKDGAIVLIGRTQPILNRVLLWAGISPLTPSTPPPRIPQVHNFQEVSEFDDFDSAKSVLTLLESRRGSRVGTIIKRAMRQFVSSGIRQSASRQLELLTHLFNSEAMRQTLGAVVDNTGETWNGIVNNDCAAFLSKLDELKPKLKADDAPYAFRLRGCLLYEKDPDKAQRCFEMSLRASREADDPFTEIATLSTYSNILYPSYFPSNWHKQRTFPHIDRLEELVDFTGYVPMVAQGNLMRDMDYAEKLWIRSLGYLEEKASVGFYDVLEDAKWARRLAIDLGDVRGEMQATFVIATLASVGMRYHLEIPVFHPWIECQRFDLLANALGERQGIGDVLLKIGRVPTPTGEISRDELMTSMFSIEKPRIVPGGGRQRKIR